MQLFSGKDHSGELLRVYRESIESAKTLTSTERSVLLITLKLHKPGFSLSFSYYGTNVLSGNREGIRYEVLLDSFTGQKERLVVSSFRIEKDLINQRQSVISKIDEIISCFLTHVIHVEKLQHID